MFMTGKKRMDAPVERKCRYPIVSSVGAIVVAVVVVYTC